MDKILELFKKITDISANEWEIFSSRLTYEIIPKKTKLLESGQTENYLNFLDSGIIRLYFQKETSEITFALILSDHFFSAYDSFLNRLPVLYNIETITEVKVWRISFDDLQYFYNNTKCGDRLGRFSSEELYLRKVKREISFLKYSAEERYRQLLKEDQEIIKKVPLKYIASYIGITPQALSRIRKRIN